MSKNKHGGYALNQSPFYCLRSKKKLASILYTNKYKIDLLCRDENIYKERDIPSYTGNIRHIEEPKFALKQVQKRIAAILKRIEIPEYVHSPKAHRSYITNAKVHISCLSLKTIDIETYFPSTSGKYVYWFFHQKMKCSSDVAGILTRLSTFNNHLPTGSPLSPILSFFSHLDMWNNIDEIVRSENCILSIYIDDIAISGDRVSNKLIWKVKQQLHCDELRSNPKKEKSYNGKKARRLTGVIISPNGILKLPNRQCLKIRKVRGDLLRCKDQDTIIHLQQKLNVLESQAQQIIKANNK
jgi:retron-type reverse transcriptase